MKTKLLGFIICFQDSSKTKSFMYNLKHKNFNEFRNRLKNFMYIDRVAVDTEFRKVGIASLMYEKLLEFCLELNIENLTAEINILPSRNEVSFHFHEKFDFVEIDTKKYSDDYEVSLQKRIL
jgi:Predicted acetyltransferase, GNAT superfamily